MFDVFEGLDSHVRGTLELHLVCCRPLMRTWNHIYTVWSLQFRTSGPSGHHSPRSVTLLPPSHGHDVRVVAKDGERLPRQGTRGDVEDRGQELASTKVPIDGE